MNLAKGKLVWCLHNEGALICAKVTPQALQQLQQTFPHTLML